MNGMQVEARSGDPSAVAGASILASLSNIHKDLSLVSPPAKACKKQSADNSSPPSDHGDNGPDSEMKDTTNIDESAGFFPSGKDVAASSTTGNENPSFDTMDVDANVGTDVGKMTAAN
ncbi:katanin p60 ATPase-containing subunit, partial [Trifolium medium]|nr:katanin p60 ATPase-containing subunit [Trifolium medium]